MSKPSFVIVIAEDERHEMLVRRYLRRCGIRAHQVRYRRSPSGEGSAESWVRANFAKEVSAYRTRQTRAATALILMIDADTHSVRERLTQLDQGLIDRRMPVVADEKIARLVPKRNVETWISCLNGELVDEETDYKWGRNDWNDFIPAAVEMLFQWTCQPHRQPINCVDSLRSGIIELKRLRF